MPGSPETIKKLDAEIDDFLSRIECSECKKLPAKMKVKTLNRDIEFRDALKILIFNLLTIKQNENN